VNEDEGGEPTRITDGPYDHTDVDWSPAGGLLTFSASRHETWNDDLVADIWVCAEDGSGIRALTDGTLSAGQPRFSPDGSTVCFTAVVADGPVISNNYLWSAPSDGSAPARRITDEEPYSLAYPSGVLEPVEDGVLFGNEVRGGVELLLVPYDGGEPSVVAHGTERQVVAAARRGGTLAMTITDATSWGEVYAGERRLSSWNTAISPLPMEEVTGATADGYPVHGWVVRPPSGNGAGPHPVLLMIHGGPFTQYGWRAFDEAQVYAAAGYAVVMATRAARPGTAGARPRRDRRRRRCVRRRPDGAARPGAEGRRPGRLPRRGARRLARRVHDHLARGAARRPVQGGRLRAAVNATDSFIGSSDIGWFFPGALWGPEPEKSPLTHVDKITAPMLIIHSEQDWRCPLEQAQRLFVALRLRGAQAEMLLFPGEGHEMSRSGLPSHRVARFEAILDWFGRWL
jgi:dipeptidyl aminopeptidase/acylaminoacyl peptidase